MSEPRPQTSGAELVRRLVAAAPVLPRRVQPASGQPEDAKAEPLPPWAQAVRDWHPRPLDLTSPARRIEYAVEDWIRPAKVGALVAAGGVGKTTLLLWLAIAHATGRKWLGQTVRPGSFVLLSNDDPQEDLDAALDLVARAMSLTAREVTMVETRVRLHSLQGLAGARTFTVPIGGAIIATDLQQVLIEAVHGIPDLVGVALDTLRQFSGGSSNDEVVVKATISGATEFALRTGAYCLVAHHTGKQNYRDGVTDQYAGSGSAALADNARAVWLLMAATWTEIEGKVQRTGQERGDPFVLLSNRGSLLMKAAEPIYFVRSDFRLERIAGAAMTRDQQADEADRKVLRAIRRGAQTKSAIAAAVGGRKSAVIDRVDDLEARGLVENTSSQSGSRIKAGYVVTALGAKHLEADDE